MIAAIDMQALKNMLGKEPSAVAASKGTPVSPAAKQQNPKLLLLIMMSYKREATARIKHLSASTVWLFQLFLLLIATNKAQGNSYAIDSCFNARIFSNIQSVIDSRLTEQQKKNTKIIFDKLKASPVELADIGVLLYYKEPLPNHSGVFQRPQHYNRVAIVHRNLTGIMNMSQAEAAALPVLRYLNKKVPNNSTILNNLGQALYALGETNSCKAVLDSCIRIFAYHPQANMTRAVIAKKEGKTSEATVFIQKSIWVAYSEMTDDFAGKNGIKLDYAALLNRFHPTSTEYINANSYRPPPQCENVEMAEELEAKWDAWTDRTQQITAKVSAALDAASGNYRRQVQQQLANKTGSATVWIRAAACESGEAVSYLYG